MPILDASEVQQVRGELVAIRDKVNTLLDAIDGAPQGNTTPRETKAEPEASSSSSSSKARGSGDTVSTKPTTNANSKYNSASSVKPLDVKTTGYSTEYNMHRVWGSG